MTLECATNCQPWSKTFGDCICTDKDLTSFSFGIISVGLMAMCCLPQIFRNFVNGESEGLSIGLVIIWNLGDVCNVVGVILSKALPTQIYMAVLYVSVDLLLNLQHCYYKYWKKPRRLRAAARAAAADEVSHRSQQQAGSDEAAECTQLARLSGCGTNAVSTSEDSPDKTNVSTDSVEDSLDKIALTRDSLNADSNHGQRAGNSSSTSSMSTGGATELSRSEFTVRSKDFRSTSSKDAKPVGLLDVEEAEWKSPSKTTQHLRALSAGLMVVSYSIFTTTVPTMATTSIYDNAILPGASDCHLTGSALVGSSSGPLTIGRVLQQHGGSGSDAPTGPAVTAGAALGWVMTVTYIGARIPQLIRNRRRGKTDGLSWSMFALLVAGNIAYLLSIFVRSADWGFVRPKLPWIIEAAGAIFLDAAIVWQCYYYSKKTAPDPVHVS